MRSGPLVIAECSVNWKDISEAKAMILAAKESGADMAKFQLYNYEVIKNSPIFDQLHQRMLGKDECVELIETGKSLGIPVFFSCMYPEAVDLVKELQVPAIKIRELDGRDVLKEGSLGKYIVDKALATGIPTYISREALPADSNYLYNATWVYCIPKYPPSVEDVDLTMLEGMPGYSNHLPGRSGVWACLVAATFGLRYLEVHCTIDHHSREEDIDKAVSLDFSELKEVVEGIKALDKMKAIRHREDEYLIA